MRTYAEVVGVDEDRTLLANLDVTDDADDGVATMADLKTIYGTEVNYQWHRCHHDNESPCKTEEA